MYEYRRYRLLLSTILVLHFIENDAFTNFSRRITSYRYAYRCAQQRQAKTSTCGVKSPTCIETLVETDRLLAINKPNGIPHHDSPSSQQLGIVNLLRQQLGVDYPRIYGVHRLDAVTSGILLFAKDSATAGSIQRSFRDKQVTKFYVGISEKKPKKKQGLVNGYMVRSRRSGWKLRRTPLCEDDRQCFASTRFYTAGIGHLSGKAKTLILFQPLTGKTHQLRVAAKALGIPLLGDPIYASRTSDECQLPERTYLHAVALHIPSSDDAPAITVWSPPPFGSVFADLDQNENLKMIVNRLIEKHCVCSAIRDAVRRDR